MENPILYDAFKSDNPSISSVYSRNAQKLVESMKWQEGDIVMDYGCGSGEFITKYLFPKINNPRCICGVDVSPQMIQFAYEHCKSQNRNNVFFSIGDIMDKYQWTFKENMVNKFVAYLVLCYVKDYRSFINKVYDFLRPGGQVGMLVPFSKAYGIPCQLLTQEKWAQYSHKNELMHRSTFAPWTYSDDVDAPFAIKESLISSGFKIEHFNVEEVKLEFASVRNLCEFLCVLTSALSVVPETMENEFISEMSDLIQNNLNMNGVHEVNENNETSNSNSSVSVQWKFLNFVATKV
jgi:ubiquinone/menaquinone biosynthesis C-methylase UbiE